MEWLSLPTVQCSILDSIYLCTRSCRVFLNNWIYSVNNGAGIQQTIYGQNVEAQQGYIHAHILIRANFWNCLALCWCYFQVVHIIFFSSLNSFLPLLTQFCCLWHCLAVFCSIWPSSAKLTQNIFAKLRCFSGCYQMQKGALCTVLKTFSSYFWESLNWKKSNFLPLNFKIYLKNTLEQLYNYTWSSAVNILCITLNNPVSISVKIYLFYSRKFFP